MRPLQEATSLIHQNGAGVATESDQQDQESQNQNEDQDKDQDQNQKPYQPPCIPFCLRHSN